MTYRKLVVIIFILSFFLNKPCAAKKQEFKILEGISLNGDLNNFKSSLFQEGLAVELNNGSELRFKDFFDLVKTNHPDIISAKIAKEIASAKRLEAQGAFDPSINSQNFFNRYNSSSAPGVSQEAFTSNTSLDFLTGYGAKFGLGAKFAEGDIKTPISPTGDAGEYFIRTQIPLLRGAIYNSQFVKEKSTRFNEIIADYLFFRATLQTLQSGSRTYWDWVANKKIFDIETNLLNLVNGQVGFVKQQADFGNLAQISVVEAQREVQKRQGRVNSTLRSLQSSSLELSKFIWMDTGVPYAIPKATQVPVQMGIPKAPSRDDLNEAKLNALIKRPEFQALELSREISNLDRKLAKNQMLPQLDTYINTGVQTGADSIGPAIEAGFNLSLPLRRRSARGRKEQAELQIKQLNLQERQLIQNVFLEIEDAFSAIDTAHSRYLAAKQDFDLSLKLENGERDRFELGDSTLFILIRRQRATVEANINLIKTITDYNKAKILLGLLQAEI